MILQYGRKRFPNACAEPRISMVPNLDARQVPWSYVVRWDLTIWLLNPGGNQTTMRQLIADCENAFAFNGQDLLLLQPDGVTRSGHVLLNANTIGGTIVVQKPSFPESKGAQHVTYRTTEVAVAATVYSGNARPFLGRPVTEFSEQIQFQGGGPRFGHLEPLTGFPIKQLKKQNTIYRATQSGQATGIFGFPEIPSPIWEDALVDSPTVAKSGPLMIGNSFVSYMISWSMNYESAGPLFGNPTPWV